MENFLERSTTHDRIVLVVETGETRVAHPALVNELELPLEICIARDEEDAFARSLFPIFST